MTTFSPDQWVIIGLVFVLGLLVGAWLTSGGRRKWRTRYNSEVEQRKALEKTHQEREAHWTAREKEWREQDSLRGAATRDRPADYRDAPQGDYRDVPRGDYRDRPAMGGHRPGDVDGDGIPNRGDRHPADDRRY
jgi:hypothetical protein